MQKLDAAERKIAIDLYSMNNLTVDDLPYSDEFDAMFEQFRSCTGRDISRHEFWKALANLRKASQLVRKKR